MSKKKNLSNYFFIFILIISAVIYSLWSVKLLGDFPWRYVFSDWIINYEGGYIRRGLLGEISINLSKSVKFKKLYLLLLVPACIIAT